MGVALALVLLGLALVTGAHAQGEPAALTEATVVEREGAVEVWVRLTQPARYQAELIDSPSRLVLDFEDTAYRWSAKAVAAGPDPLRDLRGGQCRKGVARLVVELKRRVTYTMESDREGLRIVFPRDRTAAEPAARPAPARRASSQPQLYGIVMLDAEAHAYIF